MSTIEGWFLDIRSNGKGVVGRLYDDSGEEQDQFKGSTRTAMLKKFRRKYNPKTSILINRRGKTYF